MSSAQPQRRTPPHSEESERAILGGLLLESALIQSVAARLPVEAFYGERHQLIYAGLVELKETADLRTLQAWLEVRQKLVLVGGLSYLSELDLDLPDVGRLDAYVDIVLDRWARRRAIVAGLSIVRDGYDGERPLDVTLGASVGAIQQVMAVSAGGEGFQGADSILESYLEEVEQHMMLGAAPREAGMLFGVPAVDALTGGVERGKMWIVAGYPGTGKTSAMLQMLTHEALFQRRHVAVFSLEMSKTELLLRLVSQELQIPSRRLRARHLTPVELGQVIKLYQRIKTAGTIHIDDQGGIDIRTAELRLRRLASRVDLSGAMLDYLTEMGGQEEVSERAKRLRDLFKALNLKGLVLAQLSRAAAMSNRKPRSYDLREAGEEPADGILFLWGTPVAGHDGTEWMPPEREAIVTKNRYGSIGSARYRFDAATQRMCAMEG